MAAIKIMVVDDDSNICELLRLYLEKEGFEADDILGTLAAMGEADGDTEVYILTGDRDSLQLISDKTKIILAIIRDFHFLLGEFFCVFFNFSSCHFSAPLFYPSNVY